MYAHKVDSSTSNIPTSYDESTGSLMFTAASTGQLEVINRTESVLAMTFVPAENTATPVSSITSNRHQAYIPPAPSSTSSAGWVKDFLKMKQGDRVYLRSDTGSAVTSGIVYFNTW